MRYNVHELQNRDTPDGTRIWSRHRFGPGTLEECAAVAAELDDAGKAVYIWPVIRGQVSGDGNRPDPAAPAAESDGIAPINSERYGNFG